MRLTIGHITYTHIGFQCQFDSTNCTFETPLVPGLQEISFVMAVSIIDSSHTTTEEKIHIIVYTYAMVKAHTYAHTHLSQALKLFD